MFIYTISKIKSGYLNKFEFKREKIQKLFYFSKKALFVSLECVKKNIYLNNFQN